MPPIHLFVPQFHTDEILAEIRECLDRGWTGLGFKTLEFESKWKEYTGLPNAHFLSSNTAGLHLALNILKKKYRWAESDEIITTPLTFVSTNHAILYERLKPVFADVDDSLCLNPRSVESRITKRTRAVMFVGIGGNMGRWAEIKSLCKAKDLLLILDAAHLAGTRYKGKHAGDGADVSIFSFQAVKNLPSADAGMVCFTDPECDAIARKLSWLGINKDTFQRFQGKEGGYRWKYDVDDVGFKYHGNSVIASVALVQLKYLDFDNTRRRSLAALYDELLSKVKGVTLVKVVSDCESSRHLYQVFIGNRDKVMQYFYQQDIFPGVHYRVNTEYPMFSYGKGTCPNAERRSAEVISLPLHLQLNEQDCRRVAETLAAGLENFSI